MNAQDYVTVGPAADEISRMVGVTVLPWRVTRLFELRIFPEPMRIAGNRVIPRSMLPELIAAMRERGWIPAAEVAAQ